MHEKANRTLGTLAEMKRLIINADDFGLAPGVNRAIVELQQAGALSSTTLMATAPYFSPAVYLAFAQPALSVGCHIVLVGGSPLLRPDEVPSLLDPRRPTAFSLRSTVGSFLRDLMRGRIREEEIEAEAIAQIRRIQLSGVTVSHIDSHKHIHAFPRALAPLLRAAQRCRVRVRAQSLRAVVEPARYAGRQHVATGASALHEESTKGVLKADQGTWYVDRRRVDRGSGYRVFG